MLQTETDQRLANTKRALMAGIPGKRAAVAHLMGISESRLSSILAADKNITLQTLFNVSDAAGLRVRIEFDRKEEGSE